MDKKAVVVRDRRLTAVQLRRPCLLAGLPTAAAAMHVEARFSTSCDRHANRPLHCFTAAALSIKQPSTSTPPSLTSVDRSTSP